MLSFNIVIGGQTTNENYSTKDFVLQCETYKGSVDYVVT